MRSAIAIAALLGSGPGLACEPPGAAATFESPGFRLTLQTEPPAIVPGRFFQVKIGVCAKSGATEIESLSVDARMPEHRHGMNYRPRVASLGGGLYLAEGFLFHMPGRWEFVVELRADGRSERATLSRKVD